MLDLLTYRIEYIAEAGSEPPTESELRAYSLVERWRQVERPLDPAARIQKVWRTWGEDTAEVRFALKRLGPQTPKEGETIAAQLRRLHEREDLIGYYEHKMHRMREDRLGSDYLLRTYLRDGEPAEAEKASHDSGEDTSQTVLELEISRAELQRLMAVCARQTAEIEQNERALRSDHHAPAGYANPVYTNLPPPGGTKELADGDSNSDTGLSSLHSSSDEAAVGYVLDTLV
ncbi:hypothetical protein FJT64_007003 [Amphibalanus amphitrite]|uniref:Ras-associating domain-containing protein n=1 Tax=Amphibalanus amphitrite TaxID=1232801 RepID=A0A6A4VLM4_AMPAM|nr:hypothetical protein FJT64_007003 [Amphibalanus amphitrite]